MQQSEVIKEIVKILKEEKGFDRLFSSFLEKYRSYERIENGITVRLTNLSPAEKRAIGGLFGENFEKKRDVSISAKKFEQRLKSSSRFGPYIQDVSLLSIIEAYFGTSILSKREEYAQFLQARSAFFDKYRSDHCSDVFASLLNWIEHDENQHNRFLLLYKQSQADLAAILDVFSHVFENWPLNDFIYLPVFAAKTTGNPHSFDLNTQLGIHFVYTLRILESMETNSAFTPGERSAEEVAELLFDHKILRDDLLNFVTVYQMYGRKMNGEESNLLEATVSEKAIIHLPLKEVIKMDELKAVTGSNILFVVENSGVLSYLIDFVEAQRLEASFVCGNGQLNLATLKFLDKFVDSGGTIYYSGDFDPEGLQIAQKLLMRFPDAVKLIAYNSAIYSRSLSTNTLDGKRVKMLNNVIHEDLFEVKNAMQRENRVGYQENILDILCNEIARLSLV